MPDSVARGQFEELGRQLAELEEQGRIAQQPNDEAKKVVEFAEEFLNDLPRFWRQSSVSNKKKLQSFLYADGLVYTREDGYRTHDYPILEQVKAELHSPKSCLVGRTAETSEPFAQDAHPVLMTWLARLYDAFGRHNKVQRESSGLPEKYSDGELR